MIQPFLSLRLYLSFVFAFFFHSNCFSTEIEWDKTWYSTSLPDRYSLSHVDNESAYLFHFTKDEYFIKKYSLTNFSLQKSTQIEGIDKKDKLRVSDINQLGETLFLFGRVYDHGKQLTYDFVRTIDKQSLALSEMQIISNKDKVKSLSGTTSYESHRWFGNFPSTLLYSGNHEFAFITESKNNRDIGKDPKGMQMIGRLLDSEMNVIQQSDYALPHKDAWIENIKVGNDGLIYFLYRGKGQKIKLLAGYDKYGALELAVLNLKTGDLKTTLVPETDSARILSSHLLIGTDGGITIAGINFRDKYFAKNIFVTKFNQNLEQEFNTFHPMGEDFKPQFEGDGFDEPNQTQDEARINYGYDVKGFIENSNGTSTYLIEQTFFRVKKITPDYRNINNTGMQTHTITYQFFYDDIIAINFDSDGAMNWQTVIEKRQITSRNYDSEMSFSHTFDNNTITICYSESVYEQNKTSALSLDDKKALREKNVGIKVVLDAEGNFTKEEIISVKMDSEKVAMTGFWPISNKKAIIVITKSKRESNLKKDVSYMKYGLVTW